MVLYDTSIERGGALIEIRRYGDDTSNREVHTRYTQNVQSHYRGGHHREVVTIIRYYRHPPLDPHTLRVQSKVQPHTAPPEAVDVVIERSTPSSRWSL